MTHRYYESDCGSLKNAEDTMEHMIGTQHLIHLCQNKGMPIS